MRGFVKSRSQRSLHPQYTSIMVALPAPWATSGEQSYLTEDRVNQATGGKAAI